MRLNFNNIQANFLTLIIATFLQWLGIPLFITLLILIALFVSTFIER